MYREFIQVDDDTEVKTLSLTKKQTKAKYCYSLHDKKLVFFLATGRSLSGLG